MYRLRNLFSIRMYRLRNLFSIRTYLYGFGIIYDYMPLLANSLALRAFV
jgi:hypothetical protein